MDINSLLMSTSACFEEYGCRSGNNAEAAIVPKRQPLTKSGGWREDTRSEKKPGFWVLDRPAAFGREAGFLDGGKNYVQLVKFQT